MLDTPSTTHERSGRILILEESLTDNALYVPYSDSKERRVSISMIS